MKILLGGILMAAGILIAGASGLCSLGVIIMAISENSGPDMALMVLFVGGIPFAMGLGLFFGGRRLIRAARAEQALASGSSVRPLETPDLRPYQDDRRPPVADDEGKPLE